MIDLNTFPAKAHALLALAQTHAVARMKYDGDAHEIARTLVRFGYMRWDGYNYVTNEARYILTDTGRAWLVAQHAEEPDEHSALDALCYDTEPDGLDDRTWAIGMGGR